MKLHQRVTFSLVRVFVKYAPFQSQIFQIFMYFDSAKSVTVKCSYRVVVKYFIFLLKIVGI